MRAMQIHSPCVAALTWRLDDAQGERLDELDEPVEFFVGDGDLLSAIDEALQGRAKGDVVPLALEPEQAFGHYDEALVFLLPRAALPDGIEEGMLIEASALAQELPDAPPDTLLTVSDIYPEHVVLDGNHPLAGMALQLELCVREVREATKDELRQRSAGTGFFRVAG